MSGVDLVIPPRADFLALARRVVVEAARAAAIHSEERLEMLRLAVSEACTNAIRAHHRLGTDETIRIRCQVNDGRFEVDVEDRGPGFEPADIRPLPAPEDPARLQFEGGLGLPLMQWCTDQTLIRSGPDGTHVTLVLFTPSSETPAA
ncbi:MAG: ATP-binding protein [Acidimicrobiia bacterium]|nr:ATP-binding protein [Acidimicrobiia bacterium]